MKKILVIAAHPDDEVLGLGGTIRKYYEEGYMVHCIIISQGMKSRAIETLSLSELKENALKSAKHIGYESIEFFDFPDNALDTKPILEVTRIIEKKIQAFQPNMIFTHHKGDKNIDHRIIFDATLTATRPYSNHIVEDLYVYETPSSTEWNFSDSSSAFTPNVFIDISKTIDNKLSAMREYVSELRDYPHPRSIESLKIIAQRWGTVVNQEFTEAFMLIRSIQ